MIKTLFSISNMNHLNPSKPCLGWREWAALPELGIREIKFKTDTGANTSALHVFDMQIKEARNQQTVSFKVHPLQRSSKRTVEVEVPLLGFRNVKSSNGKESIRPVIQTLICIGSERFPIELTLTNRDLMSYRMLLGREAIRGRFLVDCGKSFLQEKAKVRSSSRDSERRE